LAAAIINTGDGPVDNLQILLQGPRPALIWNWSKH
jgi:hypothetical protein